MNPLSATEVYHRLFAAFGPQHWWPADSPFEVMVGAILTQNCRGQNVERAIAALKTANALSPRALLALPPATLAELIRPAGFFNQKQRSLRGLCQVLLAEADGGTERWLRGPTTEIRHRLLKLRGIGPETADSILLYAGNHAIFVIDAYSRRIAQRIGWFDSPPAYAQLQHHFTVALASSAALFNEYHALLVELAKRHCLSRRPQCDGCPLHSGCQTARTGG